MCAYRQIEGETRVSPFDVDVGLLARHQEYEFPDVARRSLKFPGKDCSRVQIESAKTETAERISPSKEAISLTEKVGRTKARARVGQCAAYKRTYFAHVYVRSSDGHLPRSSRRDLRKISRFN
jgi:hypothetical protein